MLRIVGVQRSAFVEGEFVLLQNQSPMRIALRGHALLSEASLDAGLPAVALADDEMIPPSAYIMIRSGRGESRWGRSKDGALVYYSYLNRASSLWPPESGPLHLMHIQHTYCERKEAALMVG